MIGTMRIENTRRMKSKIILSIFIPIVLLAVLLIAPASVEAARNPYGRSLYKSPSYRNYSNGGSLYYQRGYLKKNGTYVQPHLKTKPDNSIYNNRKNILGY